MKPSIPKGTRDFIPAEVQKRSYIFDTIRRSFVRFGYQPIETPVMENLATLTGKYGEEGDKLLFKVLNNGDFLAKANAEALDKRDSAAAISSLSKRGLRYDLTVPFARFVVMHQHELSFPFKRYQIQPVWRADRPQKGRYQEFYQCDVDVVGSDSLMYEAELIQIYDQVFRDLNLSVVIKVNNRKVLAGLAEVAGVTDQFVDMTVALDKLDKIGITGVQKELGERGFGESAITTITDLLADSSFDKWKTALASSAIGTLGMSELDQVHNYLDGLTLTNKLEFDCTLARGLNYYTGAIFEVVVDTTVHEEIEMGSIGGGGRYDDLTGVFGMKGTSGVGISFGAERIYDVLEELQGFPNTSSDALQLLLVAFDDTSHQYAFKALTKLRQAGINADLYPTPAKLKKQMKYANDRNVPFVVLIGDTEMESGNLSLKNMESGDQEKLSLEAIIAQLSK